MPAGLRFGRAVLSVRPRSSARCGGQGTERYEDPRSRPSFRAPATHVSGRDEVPASSPVARSARPLIVARVALGFVLAVMAGVILFQLAESPGPASAVATANTSPVREAGAPPRSVHPVQPPAVSPSSAVASAGASASNESAPPRSVSPSPVPGSAVSASSVAERPSPEPAPQRFFRRPPLPTTRKKQGSALSQEQRSALDL
jgi:hypothetical protein